MCMNLRAARALNLMYAPMCAGNTAPLCRLMRALVNSAYSQRLLLSSRTWSMSFKHSSNSCTMQAAPRELSHLHASELAFAANRAGGPPPYLSHVELVY